MELHYIRDPWLLTRMSGLFFGWRPRQNEKMSRDTNCVSVVSDLVIWKQLFQGLQTYGADLCWTVVIGLYFTRLPDKEVRFLLPKLQKYVNLNSICAVFLVVLALYFVLFNHMFFHFTVYVFEGAWSDFCYQQYGSSESKQAYSVSSELSRRGHVGAFIQKANLFCCCAANLNQSLFAR